jgi:hypothetical protein
MRTATQLYSAILILAGFFLISIYLYRLPTTNVLYSQDRNPLVDLGDNASTKTNEAVELAPTSALNDGRSQGSAIVQHHASATTTATSQDQISAPVTNLSSLDQIIVMGRINSDDTSWVEKLPMSVFPAAWILPCDKG